MLGALLCVKGGGRCAVGAQGMGLAPVEGPAANTEEELAARRHEAFYPFLSSVLQRW